MSDELDDLLGDLPPEPKKLEPIETPAEARRRKREERLGKKKLPPPEAAFLTLEEAHKGWSATQFSRVLRMDLAEVKRRLADVVPMSGAKNSSVYSIKLAMPHLVDPIMDVEDYIRHMDPKNLPTQLTSAFWSGEQTRLKTLELASRLWPTEVVILGYATIFKIQRQQMALWADTLDEVEEMSDEHRRVVEQLIESLQNDITFELEQFTKENATPSELHYLKERLDAIKDD